MSNENTPKDQAEDHEAETTEAHTGSASIRSDEADHTPHSFDHASMALRGRLGGLSTSVRHRGEDMTAPARKGFLARFERQAREDLMPRGSLRTWLLIWSLPILQKGR